MGRGLSRDRLPGFDFVAGVVLLCIAGAIWCASRWTVHRPAGRPYQSADRTWPDMRIDVNAADVGELDLLPGIGPALADAIVADRNAHGFYTKLEDLDRVRNIGEKRLEGMRPFAIIVPIEPAAEE